MDLVLSCPEHGAELPAAGVIRPGDLWHAVASHAGDCIPRGQAGAPSSEVWILLCGVLLQASANHTSIYQSCIVSMFPSSFFRPLTPVEPIPHIKISLLQCLTYFPFSYWDLAENAS